MAGGKRSAGGRTTGRTADQVLDVAERLVQTRGFNAFSYADIAAELGIRKASLHYHFPSKGDLGKALIERYTASFVDALAAIDARARNAEQKIERYARIYADVLAAGRICLCGMLAAEYTTLQKPMQRAIRAFFDANEAWLVRVLEDGRTAGTLAFPGTARAVAAMLTASLEGGMLLARAYGDASRLTATSTQVIQNLVRAARVGR